jgi:hypothetical protein
MSTPPPSYTTPAPALTPVPAPAARNWLPRWRKMTWTIVIFSALMLLWAIVGAHDTTSQQSLSQCVAQNQGVLSAHDCKSLNGAGAAIGVGLLVGLWFMGFIVLSLVWFMTRPRTAR